MWVPDGPAHGGTVGCGSTETSTVPPTQQIVFSPRIPMSAVSPSHPHFLPLLLPFSLVPPPKGKVFSLSLCTPHPLTPCPALPWPLPPAWPQAPRSGSASSAALQHHPLPRSCFFWKAPRPNPAPAEVTRPPASSGAPWAGAAGAGSPHHTHTCCKANLYLPLRLSRWRNVRTHDKAANRAAGGSPPGPAERQELGLSASPGPAPRPSLQGAHKWDLPQAGFTPPAPG